MTSFDTEARVLTLVLLSFLGGLLTILSPCILPVVPFVFARAGQPFARTNLPLLAGMAITFAAVASLAAFGGGWAVAANQYGRVAALVLMALFAVTLLSSTLADLTMRPLVRLGQRLTPQQGTSGIASSFLLGGAIGLLWTPCAGPILGLVLTGAAINGASAGTSLALLAYAAGAATALGAALFAGGRLLGAMKRFIRPGEWVRRSMGAAVLASVVAIAFGWDVSLLSRVNVATTASIEEVLIGRGAPSPAKREMSRSERPIELQALPSVPASGEARLIKAALQLPTSAEPQDKRPVAQIAAGTDLPIEGTLPGFKGAGEWINSPPLTAEALRGKVVLVNFWTFDCINCRRALPYVRAWAEKYKDHGLVVIGVHSPEFAFEKVVANVRQAVKRLNITHPVAIDNDFAIWNAFGNQYWPANYFVDARGRIRYHHFGEHDYENSERVIRQLLEEAGYRDLPGGFVLSQGNEAPRRAFAEAPEATQTRPSGH